MKIVTVLGARPQFIKASVVSAALADEPDVREVVVHTGQHFDANMSDVFFRELGMRVPDYNLGINSGPHGQMTGRMLERVEQVLLDEAPDAVLVYGDTDSTLAGALAAAKLHVPVAHVEAGLRSFNLRMPEEINRILTDRISNWLFTPTDAATGHLRHEGVESSRIHQCGDVMYDVVLHHGARAEGMTGNVVERLGLPRREYVLVTVHRAENTDEHERLRVIVEALLKVASEMPVLWPVHPRSHRALESNDLVKQLKDRVKIIGPLSYLDMVSAQRFAAVIATDSGGVQKEAFFHGVPCVTLRDETEWVELVESGWNHLAPPVDPESICRAILEAKGCSGASVHPYGTGDAAAGIVSILANGAEG